MFKKSNYDLVKTDPETSLEKSRLKGIRFLPIRASNSKNEPIASDLM